MTRDWGSACPEILFQRPSHHSHSSLWTLCFLFWNFWSFPPLWVRVFAGSEAFRSQALPALPSGGATWSLMERKCQVLGERHGQSFCFMKVSRTATLISCSLGRHLSWPSPWWRLRMGTFLRLVEAWEEWMLLAWGELHATVSVMVSGGLGLQEITLGIAPELLDWGLLWDPRVLPSISLSRIPLSSPDFNTKH